MPLTSQKPDWAWCLQAWLSLCAQLRRISRTCLPQGTVLEEAPLESTFPSDSPVLLLATSLSCFSTGSRRPCVGCSDSRELQLWCEQRVSLSRLLPLCNPCPTAVCVSWWKCYAQQGLLHLTLEDYLEDLRITTALLTTTIHQPLLYVLRNSGTANYSVIKCLSRVIIVNLASPSHCLLIR